MRERIHPSTRHGIRDGRRVHIHVQDATVVLHDPDAPDGTCPDRRVVVDVPAGGDV